MGDGLAAQCTFGPFSLDGNYVKREKSRGSIVFGEDFLEERVVELRIIRRGRAEKEIMNTEC